MTRNFYKIIKEILCVIQKNKSFFIAGHFNPDGDCIGAQVALTLFLRRIGKEVCSANRDTIPSLYDFLPGIEQIKKVKKVRRKFDIGIFLDSSNFARVGNIIDIERQVKTTVNIDHHVDAVNFAEYNYIDSQASSTSEQIYILIKNSKYSINKNEALCLYTGIVMDTGGFQQLNTTTRTHKIAADLLKKEINPYYVNQKLYKNKTASQLKLTGLVLSTLELNCSGQIAFLKLTNKMYKQAQSSPEETEGLIDYAGAIQGVKVVILFKETGERENIKVSFRSKDEIDVNNIAKIFGGGGHRKAAGCTVKGAILEVQKKMIEETRKALNNYGRSSQY